MPRLRVVSRPGKKIDFKQWVGLPAITIDTNADSTQLGGSLGFTAPATILRIRGQVMLSFDETKQAGDRMRVAVALGVISSDAFALGTTAVPDPAAEADYPWLYWSEHFLESFVAAGEESEGSTVHRFMIDSKAMRKMKPGQSLAWIFQLASAAGAPSTLIQTAQTRVLIGT